MAFSRAGAAALAAGALTLAGLAALPARPAAAAAAVFGHVDPTGFTLDPAGTFTATAPLISRLEADPRIHKVALSTLVTTPSPAHTGSWPLCHPTFLDPALS